LKLPDPLVFEDGRRVTDSALWRERRKELVDLFSTHVYGRSPGEVDAVQLLSTADRRSGTSPATHPFRHRITLRRGARAASFGMLRYAPDRDRRSPCFLFLDHRGVASTSTSSDYLPIEAVLARGYALAVLDVCEVAPDDPIAYRDGVLSLFPENDGPDACKMIGAWAWAASRAMDVLARDPEVDPSRVAIMGHSRGGKTALWAAAQDERFALAISNESGNSGAAISRRPVGESIERINARFPHWFCDNYRRYDDREDALPVDQHELIALIAPRAVAIGSAADNEWADPEGEFLGLAHASSVYALWGMKPIAEAAWPKPGAALSATPRHYHLREGKHDLLPIDWRYYLDFADRVL
jgi:hypothetical protein